MRGGKFGDVKRLSKTEPVGEQPCGPVLSLWQNTTATDCSVDIEKYKNSKKHVKDIKHVKLGI